MEGITEELIKSFTEAISASERVVMEKELRISYLQEQLDNLNSELNSIRQDRNYYRERFHETSHNLVKTNDWRNQDGDICGILFGDGPNFMDILADNLRLQKRVAALNPNEQER